MRLLVTGKSGQLVRSLAERAAVTPSIHLLPVGRPELDLEVPGQAAQTVTLLKPDFVINAAAYTSVDAAEDEPDRAARINGDAAGEIAAAARSVGAPMVQISTDYVFDGRAAAPYREDAPTNPLSAYGRSKLLGEQQVRSNQPDHLILRTAWVYSPFGTNFVRTMMRLAQTRDVVTVVEDQVGNPTSALDLADALLMVVSRWIQGDRTGLGQTYHLAGTGSASWFSFAQAIFEELGVRGAATAAVEPIRSKNWPAKAPRPANSQLSSDRFSREFAFGMPPWRDSLKTVLDRIAAAEGLGSS